MRRHLPSFSQAISLALALSLFSGAAHASDIDDALLGAVRGGDVNAVKALLKQGADPNTRVSMSNGFPKTVLMWAAEWGYLEIVDLLLTHGAAFDFANAETRRTWRTLAINNRIAVIDRLLKAGVDINFIDVNDIDGQTILMVAATQDNTETLQALLAHGAQVNIKDQRGETALSKASKGGQAKAIRLLLAHGANANEMEPIGRTALYRAAEGGHVEAIQALLEGGANVNQIHRGGYSTALMAAADRGHKEAVRVLLEAGADPRVRAEGGWTTLMAGIEGGNAEVIRLLLAHDADPHEPLENGWTAMQEAAQRGDVAILQVLLEAKTESQGSQKNEELDTFLISAVSGTSDQKPSNVENVKALLDKGANPNASSERGMTALMIAATNNDAKTAQLLLVRGADVNAKGNHEKTALFEAVERGLTEIVQLLLQHGADVHQPDASGTPVLMYAARGGYAGGEFRGQADIVKALLDKDAQVDQRDNDRYTALLAAAGLGHTPAVEILADHGADLEAQAIGYCGEESDRTSWLDVLTGENAWAHSVMATPPPCQTPLMMAVFRGHIETAKLLLQRGANPNTKSHGLGATALHWTARRGEPQVVRLLLDHNADIAVTDSDGKTPLIWAEEAGNTKAAQLLRAVGTKP